MCVSVQPCSTTPITTLLERSAMSQHHFNHYQHQQFSQPSQGPMSNGQQREEGWAYYRTTPLLSTPPPSAVGAYSQQPQQYTQQRQQHYNESASVNAYSMHVPPPHNIPTHLPPPLFPANGPSNSYLSAAAGYNGVGGGGHSGMSQGPSPWSNPISAAQQLLNTTAGIAASAQPYHQQFQSPRPSSSSSYPVDYSDRRASGGMGSSMGGTPPRPGYSQLSPTTSRPLSVSPHGPSWAGSGRKRPADDGEMAPMELEKRGRPSPSTSRDGREGERAAKAPVPQKIEVLVDQMVSDSFLLPHSLPSIKSVYFQSIKCRARWNPLPFDRKAMSSLGLQLRVEVRNLTNTTAEPRIETLGSLTTLHHIFRTAPGDAYSVQISVVGRNGRVFARGEARCRAVFSLAELQQLLGMAEKHFGQTMDSFTFLYRCKPDYYWAQIRNELGGIMQPYAKDANGHDGSPINNGRLHGLFFSAKTKVGGAAIAILALDNLDLF